MIERATSDEIEYALFNDRSLGNKVWLSEESVKALILEHDSCTNMHIINGLKFTCLDIVLGNIKELEDKECFKINMKKSKKGCIFCKSKKIFDHRSPEDKAHNILSYYCSDCKSDWSENKECDE